VWQSLSQIANHHFGSLIDLFQDVMDTLDVQMTVRGTGKDVKVSFASPLNKENATYTSTRFFNEALMALSEVCFNWLQVSCLWLILTRLTCVFFSVRYAFQQKRLQMLRLMKDLPFSALWDESMDGRAHSELIVCWRFVDPELRVREIYGSTIRLSDGTGQTVFKMVKKLVQRSGLSLGKLVSAVTDGASSNLGCKRGASSRMAKLVPWLFKMHCMNHQYVHVIACDCCRAFVTVPCFLCVCFRFRQIVVGNCCRRTPGPIHAFDV
jgi:hypothetical protein